MLSFFAFFFFVSVFPLSVFPLLVSLAEFFFPLLALAELFALFSDTVPLLSGMEALWAACSFSADEAPDVSAEELPPAISGVFSCLFTEVDVSLPAWSFFCSVFASADPNWDFSTSEAGSSGLSEDLPEVISDASPEDSSDDLSEDSSDVLPEDLLEV